MLSNHEVTAILLYHWSFHSLYVSRPRMWSFWCQRNAIMLYHYIQSSRTFEPYRNQSFHFPDYVWQAKYQEMYLNWGKSLCLPQQIRDIRHCIVSITIIINTAVSQLPSLHSHWHFREYRRAMQRYWDGVQVTLAQLEKIYSWTNWCASTPTKVNCYALVLSSQTGIGCSIEKVCFILTDLRLERVQCATNRRT